MSKKQIIIFIICNTLLLFIIVCSIWYNKGSYLSEESQNLLLNYLDKRTFATKIFSISKTDWGNYQARELSYLFDYLDAQFIRFSIQQGFPHFYSATYYVCLLLILILLPIIISKYMRFHSMAIYFLSASLFLTSPAVFFSGNYFRSAKILSMTLLIILLFLIVRWVRSSQFQMGNYPLAIFVSILMSTSDRQGYFFLIASTVVIAILWFCSKKRIYLKLLLPLIFSNIFVITYVYIIGPWLIHFFAKEHVSTATLLPDLTNYRGGDSRPEITGVAAKALSFLRDSCSVVLSNIGYFFGNVRISVLFILSAPLLIILFLKRKKIMHQKNAKNLLIILSSSFFLIIIMFYFMIIKHPPIIWPSVRRVYYVLPISLFSFFSLIIFSAIMLKLWGGSKKYIILVLSLLVCFNITSLPMQSSVIKQTGNRKIDMFFRDSEELLVCLKTKEKKASKLPANFAKLCNKLKMN